MNSQGPGNAKSAEGPRGGSAHLKDCNKLSQHWFRSQRRYAAIQARELELEKSRSENVKLKLERSQLLQKVQSLNHVILEQ